MCHSSSHHNTWKSTGWVFWISSCFSHKIGLFTILLLRLCPLTFSSFFSFFLSGMQTWGLEPWQPFWGPKVTRIKMTVEWEEEKEPMFLMAAICRLASRGILVGNNTPIVRLKHTWLTWWILSAPRRLDPAVTRVIPNLIPPTDCAPIRTWAAHRLARAWVLPVSHFPHSTEGQALPLSLTVSFIFLKFLFWKSNMIFFRPLGSVQFFQTRQPCYLFP